MNQILITFFCLLSITTNAQLILDGFSSKNLEDVKLVSTLTKTVFQNDSLFILNHRQIDTLQCPSYFFWNNYNIIVPDSAISGKHILFYLYNKMDKPALIVEYKSGRVDGFKTIFYENGIKKRETLYKEGLLNGCDFRYNINGLLNQFETYANDTLNGVSMSFFETGHPSCIKNYKDGKLHGEYLCWSESSGNKYTITQSLYYLEGKKTDIEWKWQY